MARSAAKPRVSNHGRAPILRDARRRLAPAGSQDDGAIEIVA
jgi:hypothetical protein